MQEWWRFFEFHLGCLKGNKKFILEDGYIKQLVTGNQDVLQHIIQSILTPRFFSSRDGVKHKITDGIMKRILVTNRHIVMKHWVVGSRLDLSVRRYRSWIANDWAKNKFGNEFVSQQLEDLRKIIFFEMQSPMLYENATSQNDDKQASKKSKL